jgi:nucleotide-binding universal stress UspA family protein
VGSFDVIEVAFALWIVVGCSALIFMIRHGHHPVRWAIASFALGPFVVVPAFVARMCSRRIGSVILSKGSKGTGPLSVLVGLDGSTASHQALLGTLAVFGDRIGSLTLAYAINFEAAKAKKATSYRTMAENTLGEASAIAAEDLGISPATVILAGNPARALTTLAIEQGVDWIVIGTRGKGEAEWLYGSTATALAAASAPVVIIGGQKARF